MIGIVHCITRLSGYTQGGLGRVQQRETKDRGPCAALHGEAKRSEAGPRSSTCIMQHQMHACHAKSCMCDRMSMHIRAIRFAHLPIGSPPCRGRGSSVCADSEPTDRPREQLRHPPMHLREAPYLSTTVLRTNRLIHSARPRLRANASPAHVCCPPAPPVLICFVSDTPLRLLLHARSQIDARSARRGGPRVRCPS